MKRLLTERYRCSEDFSDALVAGSLSKTASYFDFDRVPCFARHDASQTAAIRDGRVVLPFDADEAATNLRLERYMRGSESSHGLGRRLYYAMRPLLPFSVRVLLQTAYFRSWHKIAFPAWPVDVTIEDLIEGLLYLSMRAAGVSSLPFIWFWPDGASSATIVTHDVDSPEGRDFCGALMEIDESFGFRSSFQIVPEQRYSVSHRFLAEIRSRGHEVNVHDLNHDGRLFSNRAEFCARARVINRYGRLFNSKGFRSAVLYRNVDWYDQLDFEYDMSIPNVGHLEPQHGGCCTVFPYFIGNILELPVTTTQDYSLFHILRDYSIDVWRAQAERIQASHGLLSFLVHPDYLLDRRALETYRALLSFVRERGAAGQTWISTPNGVNAWWRQRSQMRLVSSDGGWRIQGPGKERARIAHAVLAGDRVTYTLPDSCAVSSRESRRRPALVKALHPRAIARNPPPQPDQERRTGWSR